MSSINEALRRSNRTDCASGTYIPLSPMPEKSRSWFRSKWFWAILPLIALAAFGGYWFRQAQPLNAAVVEKPEPAVAPAGKPAPVVTITESSDTATVADSGVTVSAPDENKAPDARASVIKTPDEKPNPAASEGEITPTQVAAVKNSDTPSLAKVIEEPRQKPRPTSTGLADGLKTLPENASLSDKTLGTGLAKRKDRTDSGRTLADGAHALPDTTESVADQLGTGPMASLDDKSENDVSGAPDTANVEDSERSNLLMATDYFHIATVSADQGRYSEALESYRRAIALHPQMVEAYLNLGNIYLFHFEDHKKARSMYESVLKLDPENKMAQNNLGVVMLRQGRLNNAEKRFKAALKSDQKYVDPLYNLACVAARSGRADQALSFLARAYKLEPDVAEWAADDDDLKILRGHPEFIKIVEASHGKP